MAQTIFSLYVHVVFSTKNRMKIIPVEVENDLYAFIGGVCKSRGSSLVAAGGTSNHLHLLISLNKNHLVPTLIGDIKRSSSRWIKDKSRMLSKFAWQDGYASFSVGHSQLKRVKEYISSQKEHHRERLFEDEMRIFFKIYEIDFKEEYIWD